jgi:hypothetical protein
MIEEGFRDYLRKRGKTHHVVQGLMNSVRLFDDYLKKQGQEIRLATKKDLLDYAMSCENEKKDSARIRIRGVGLYFAYTGSSEMAAAANGIRQAGISKLRCPFRLKDFLWVSQAHISQLKTVGITDIARMIGKGKTPDDRAKLARSTGMTTEDILELVKLADLARITGVKGIRARLYHDAGLDTLDKIAALDATMLREICTRFVKATSFPGVPPTLKEAAFTVTSARTLPRIVEW